MKHEKEKKRHYERRILEIEHASFTPLVLVECQRVKGTSIFYKRLASLLANKRGNIATMKPYHGSAAACLSPY